MTVLSHLLLVTFSELLIALHGFSEFKLHLIQLFLSFCWNGRDSWQGAQLLVRYIKVCNDPADSLLINVSANSLSSSFLGRKVSRLGTYLLLRL